MIEPNSAEEHLRVIRSLMERATVYRAISAPTALVGGMLGSAAGLWLARGGREMDAREFIMAWLAVLALTLAANTFFIWRKSRRERAPLFTAGLKWAIRSAVPILIIVAVITAIFWRENETAETLPLLVVIWIAFYGLALLATASFAPRSLVLLGWIFLAAGAVGMIWTGPIFSGQAAIRAQLAMALTFGVFHLLYAALTWPRSAQAE